MYIPNELFLILGGQGTEKKLDTHYKSFYKSGEF